MALARYNGYSPEERMEADRIQKAAARDGTLKYEKVCEICGLEHETVLPHLEDYSKPLTAILPLCIRCHLELHCRFRRPNAWRNLLLRAYLGEAKADAPILTNNDYFRLHPYTEGDAPLDSRIGSVRNSSPKWFHLISKTRKAA